MKKMPCDVTKKGLPALWEFGGGRTNTGEARIICQADGSPKKPVYIRKRGVLANDNHALFIIEPGDIIIQADHHREDFIIKVFHVEEIVEEGGEKLAALSQVACFSEGEWDNEEMAEKYSRAISVARAKALCYHCREPHYTRE